MAPADETDRIHACCLGGAHAGRGVFNHDTVARLNAHPPCGMEEEVGRRLPVGNVGCGKHVIEETGEPRRLQAGANAVGR